MAEVKTYKCDICGGVYHVDESVEHRVMDLADITNGDNSREVKHYEHICDNCAGEIRSIIRDPGYTERITTKYDKEYICVCELGKHLDRIFDACDITVPVNFHKIDEYKTKKDSVIAKIKHLKKSVDKWKYHAALGYTWGTVLSIVLIFIIVGRIISLFA